MCAVIFTVHLHLFVTHTEIDSGHGGQTKDLDGDEEDGYDEGDDYMPFIPQETCVDSCAIVIYPVDFKQNGHIVDDVRLRSITSQATSTYQLL